MTELGRGAVLVATASTVVHLTLAGQAFERSPSAAAALAAMGVACLTCLPSLWRGGSLHSWMSMLGLTGAMLFVHWALCFACGPEVHHTEDLDVTTTTRLFGQGLASLALWLMAAEMALAITAAVRLLTRSPKTTNRFTNPEVAPS